MKKNIFRVFFIMLLLTNILYVTKVDAVMKNNNPLLREIKIDGEDIKPEFDQFITDYVLAVDENKEKIEIEAITDDPNASVEIIGDTNLKKGKNDFELKVTAEDEKTTYSYFLHITRGNKEKANANLKSLEVKGNLLNPKFNEKDINYLVEYDGYIEKLDISAIPENENAKVEILDNNGFNSTIHIVTIKVTAEDGITTKEYKLTAKKAGENLEDPSGLEEYEKDLEETNKKKEQKQILYVSLGIVGVLIIGGIAYFMVKKGKKKTKK